METANSMRQDTVEMLRRFAPAFVPDEGNLPAIADAARWLCVPGGSTLLEKGEPSDTIYFVLSGLLGAWIGSAGTPDKMVRRLGPGEILGEMGCITGEPRSATVRALRSTELIAVDWRDIERIATTDPGILLSFCRTVIHRLVQSEQGRTPTFRPRSFALMPINEGIDLRSFGERFKAALGLIGSTFLVSREECQNMTGDELFQLEISHQHVIYLAERANPAWSKLCLGQADTVLMVAHGNRPPQTTINPKDVYRPGIPFVLVLSWDNEVQPAKTAEWTRAAGASRHFHIRRSSDMERMARTPDRTRLRARALGRRGSRPRSYRCCAGVARERHQRRRGDGHQHRCFDRRRRRTGVGHALPAGAGTSVLPRESAIRNHDPTAFAFGRAQHEGVSRALVRRAADRRYSDPYSCVSTNLYAAQIAVHQSGSLQLWTRASAAVPGVFPPVVIGETVYVDGGVLNNMPSDLIRDTGAGFVLGVDVGAGAVPPQAEATAAMLTGAETNLTEQLDVGCAFTARMPLNILELLIRVGCLGDEARWGLRRKQCDVLIGTAVVELRSPELQGLYADHRDRLSGCPRRASANEQTARTILALPMRASPRAQRR